MCFVIKYYIAKEKAGYLSLPDAHIYSVGIEKCQTREICANNMYLCESCGVLSKFSYFDKPGYFVRNCIFKRSGLIIKLFFSFFAGEAIISDHVI